MIIYKSGNLLNITSGVIAHGCNAQGVMGSGVAKLIKEKYPTAYRQYLTMNKQLGTVELVHVTKNLWVANCITQEFYGRDTNKVYVNYHAVDTCFRTLNNLNIQINIPLIGAGLANGDWAVIEEIINSAIPHKEVICWKL